MKFAPVNLSTKSDEKKCKLPIGNADANIKLALPISLS